MNHDFPTVISLLVAYGICFGIQNKAAFLRDRFDWLDAMLACSYCTGFHAGWLTYGLTRLIQPVPFISSGSGVLSLLASLMAWSFASAAICYLVDVTAAKLEK